VSIVFSTLTSNPTYWMLLQHGLTVIPCWKWGLLQSKTTFNKCNNLWKTKIC